MAAYRRLREAILEGHIAAGTRINELDLATAWKVSRTPIRDALLRLEAEGLVQALPGRGMVVPLRGQADFDELYELREILEGRAARRAAERATAEVDSRLKALVKAFGTALKEGDIERMMAIDSELHARIAVASGSAWLAQAIETVRAQVRQVRLKSFRTRGRAARSLREMAAVVGAIRARDGARAEASMHQHIASLRADLGLVLQSHEP